MNPRPKAVALITCDQVIVDERTKKPSLIGIFTGLGVDDFPSDAQRFSVCATLTGTSGSGTIDLRVNQVATGDEIYRQSGVVNLQDRTDMVNVFFRIRQVRFPAPGFYLLQLYVDDDLIEEAQRRLRVYRIGGPS